MSTSGFRKFAKSMLPSAIVHQLKRSEEFLRRIGFIVRVTREIRGVGPEDRKILRRFVIAAPFAALKELDAWRDPPLPEDALVVAKDLGRFLLRQNTDDLAHALPSNYDQIFAFIRGRVSPGDTVIDGGANIGAISVFLSELVGPGGKVVAIEMMPDTAECLRRNLRHNALERVLVIEAALSRQEGQTVTAQAPPGFCGQASIEAGDRGGRATLSIPVKTTTLDALASNLGEIAFLKLDLEGAELAALHGASNVLPRIRCILFESWIEGGGDVSKLLTAAGFEVTALDSRNLCAVRRTVR